MCDEAYRAPRAALFAIVLFLSAASLAWGAAPGVGLERASSAIEAMDSMCAQDKSCSRSSILPIVNRTGDAAVCIQPKDGHYVYVTSSPQKIYLHQYFNGCPQTVRTFLKVDNRWLRVPVPFNAGADVVLELVYGGGQGSDASVVMFCKRGEPRDDLTCH